MYYLISILLGLVPEVLFITLFLSYTKNLKEKRILLFLCISIVYFVTMLIKQYETIYYLLFITLIYISLKILYKDKTQIIDVFVTSISLIYVLAISYLCFLFLNKDLSNYYFLYIIDRILLFLPFIFKNNFNIIYNLYCKLWNRNDKENRSIKSITLRNISLIIINSTIVFINIYMLSIINFIK